MKGDVIGIVNTAGTTVAKYTYDAWGKCDIDPSGTTISLLNPFRYRGYYFDSELGFYYLNSRYYNHEWGRFINADVYVSTGQGILGYNMFAYCNNNPIILKDVTGTAAGICVMFDDAGNPISLSENGFGGSSGDFAGSTYHYGVDLSIADRSSLFTGGIYNCGYSTYGYTSGPSYASPSGMINSKEPHGNSKESTKLQHGYEISSNNGVEKVGISGQPLNQDGSSPRANYQVNKWNKEAGYNKYWATVLISNVPGRAKILIWERSMADYYRSNGEPMSRHKRP